MISVRLSLFPLCLALCSAAEPVQKLPTVRVSGATATTAADLFRFPSGVESIGALDIADTVNALDAEDALKYLPSLFLRKRNAGDTQAVMATRVWGVSSSARSLIYADGVLLSALLANNNSIGGPRWGLVAPAEIERIDVMYGPFSAAFAGNSMGAVVEITTRQPEKFEASLEHTFAWQSFRHYGTHDTFRTHQTAATAGQRTGRFSLWLSANHQDSHSQPLNYVTSTTLPAGVTGGFAARNKFGQSAPVVGASGLQHSRITNAKFKAAFDFAPTIRGAYTFGLWRNDADASAESFLRNAAGDPTFAGLAGFASGTYEWEQQHTAHHATLRTNTRGAFDLEASAAAYRMDRDRQRLPTSVSTGGTLFGNAGRLARLEGTNWMTADFKFTWRSDVLRYSDPRHLVTFGLHYDSYRLTNPTFNTSDWRTGGAITSLASQGDGRTRTQAVWAQDVWRVTPQLKVIAGGRFERWRAHDGLNINGATTVRQPEVKAERFSPKLSAVWNLAPEWTLTASIAQAYRFATAAELYQLVSTGATFTSPNPNLKPDDVLATELKLERALALGRVRLSLFQDDVHDAIIAQFQPLAAGSTQLFSFASNVDHVRARGAELVFEHHHVFIRGLALNASATYVDARTLATKGQGQFGSAIGRRLPNIPDWRTSLVLTYRPDQRWTFTLAGRYSGMLTTTLDAADTNPNTWQGFAAWFVADARIVHRFSRHWTASVGADNLLNRRYFLFHPFPQRTVFTHLKYDF
jgi:iron complex outermembrane receptor protein